MSEEVFKLEDGSEVSTGLLMPDARCQKLMADVPDYPVSMLLEDSDIKKGLANDYYLESRKQLAPWMIHQGSLGKCNASAVQGALDQIRMAQGMKHVVLNDCHLYANINGGSDRGSTLIEGFQYTQRFGIAPRVLSDGAVLPLNWYNRRQIDRSTLELADKEALKFRGLEWYKVPLEYEQWKRTVASALARRQPVVFAWHVGNNSMRLNNGYAVVGRGPGNHANVFHSAKWVGGNDIVHPDDRNSWGPTQSANYGTSRGGWGDGGFALFTMEDAYACARYHATYVVTSAIKDEGIL